MVDVATHPSLPSDKEYAMKCLRSPVGLFAILGTLLLGNAVGSAVASRCKCTAAATSPNSSSVTAKSASRNWIDALAEPVAP